MVAEFKKRMNRTRNIFLNCLINEKIRIELYRGKLNKYVF